MKWLVAWLISLSLLGLHRPAEADDSAAPTYEKDIKPLFAKRCTVCHRASKRSMLDISAGLALDSLEGILAGSARDKVIAPGKAARERARAPAGRSGRRSPDAAAGQAALTRRSIELVRRWIDAGAPRGTAQAAPGKAAVSPPRRVRFIRSLDVNLPCEVKLAPGSADRAQGGRAELSACAVGPLPAVTALAFRGDSRLLAVGTYGQVVLWDLHDGGPAGAITRDSRPGSLPGVQPRRPPAGSGRRAAGALGSGAGLYRARRHVDPRFHGTRRRRLRGRHPARRRTARLGLLRPDGSPLEPRPRQVPTGSFEDTPILSTRSATRPTAVRCSPAARTARSSESTPAHSRKSAPTANTTKRCSPWRLIPTANDSSPPAASRRFAGGAMTATSRRRAETVIRARCISLPSAATAAG